MDRAYVDFQRLHRFHEGGAFFVTRTKKGIRFRRRYSHTIDATTGLRSDHTVLLSSSASRKHYPDPLRRIHFYDEEQQRHLKFLTNNFDLPAITICHLYKSRGRWAVFKWIKQHLRIKAFYGYSENAVKTQVWTAVSIYVLIAIVKKRLALEPGLHEILQVLSLTLFEQVPILQAFGDAQSQQKSTGFSNQLNLLDYSRSFKSMRFGKTCWLPKLVLSTSRILRRVRHAGNSGLRVFHSSYPRVQRPR